MSEGDARTILLVEDSDDDVFAMKRALKRGGIANALQVVTDGREAIEYLSGAGAYANRERHPLPFLVFLDLKLPYVHGFEVLEWIRAQPQLKSVVVVVLTGSAEQRDRDRADALGAHSYVVKPPTPEVLSNIVKSLSSE